MQVVVTGGAGFIGSTLVDSLLAGSLGGAGEAPASVRVIDDLSSGCVDDLAAGADLVEIDVADARATQRLHAALRGADVVFHLAAHRSVHRSVSEPLAADHANTHGTLAVLAAARAVGVRRLVYASSSSVYGATDVLPTAESAPTWPRSPYAVSKLAGEHYCRVYAELHGLAAVSLRYFNVYGPRQRPSAPYATVIPLFVDALRCGRAPEVHGDGTQTRDFTYVADAVDATVRAAACPPEHLAGRVFNVAGGREHSLLSVLSLLAEIVAGTRSISRPQPVFGPPRPGDVTRTWADVSAATEVLGWAPEVDLPTGLARTVAWLDDARSHDVDGGSARP